MIPKGTGRVIPKGTGRVIPVGDCFRWAVHDVAKNGGEVVHATVATPLYRGGHRFEHAWVERGGRCHDWQTEVTGRPALPVADYREFWSPRRVRRYSEREAIRNACSVHGHYGPWEGS